MVSYGFVKFAAMELSVDDIARINTLRPLLSKQERRDLNLDDLIRIASHADFLIARDGDEIVGMATLHVQYASTHPDGAGYVNDVVVLESHQRQGIAEALNNILIYEAMYLGLEEIGLTSNPENPDRFPAIKLYTRLGYKKRETNVYVLKLS